MKLTKPAFSTEMLRRGEVTPDMARAAGKRDTTLSRSNLKLAGGRFGRCTARREGGRYECG